MREASHQGFRCRCTRRVLRPLAHVHHTPDGFTAPVQARAYGYMGLALNEALVSGVPGNRSIASQLIGIGTLLQPEGNTIQMAARRQRHHGGGMRGL